MASIPSVSLTRAAYEVTVAKKQLDATKEQGQQALQLIESAAAPQLAPTGQPGQLVNVKA
jgi:hypothetical protein